MENSLRQGRTRRLTAIALCLAMALGLVLPSHALAMAEDPPAVAATGAELDHNHSHGGGPGGHEVSGHCSVTGCYSALPSAGAAAAGPELMKAGCVGDQSPHLSPALKRDPPVPRST